MTIDERIEALVARDEALAARDEALTAKLEALATERAAHDAAFAAEMDAIAGTDAAFKPRMDALAARHAALAQTVELNGHQITDRIGAITKDGEHLRTLARTADAHQRRIEHLQDRL